MPTRPGAEPDQLATVRMGARWETRPWRTWCEYCQTASAMTRGALGWMLAKTSRPNFCEEMKPCGSAAANLLPRAVRRLDGRQCRVRPAG